MLHAFHSTSLGRISSRVLSLHDKSIYLIQVLRHQTLSARGLHDLEHQVAVLCETYLELERACLAAEGSFWNGGWREVEDLKGSDAELEEAVHRFLVVACHDTHFGDGAEE